MATVNDLQSVHDGLTKWCQKVLDEGECTAKEAAVIMAFLKANSITAAPVAGSAVNALREKLEARRKKMPPVNLDEAAIDLARDILQ